MDGFKLRMIVVGIAVMTWTTDVVAVPMNSDNLTRSESIEEVQLLWKLGQREEASGKVNDLIVSYPNDAEVLETAGYIYIGQREYAKAEDVFVRLLAREKDRPELLKALAEAYFETRQYAPARIRLEEYVEKTGGDIQAIHRLGDALGYLGEKRQAAENYEKALSMLMIQPEMGPNDHIEKMELLWKLRRKAQVMASLDSVLERYPDSPELLRTAAYFYLEEGRIDSALRTSEALAKIEGQEAIVRRLNTYAAAAKEDWVMAYEQSSQLIDLVEQDRDFYRLRAEILAHVRRWKEAKQAYMDLLGETPGDMDTLWQYRLNVVKPGSPQVRSHFKYLHRPAEQRDYRFEQSGQFWVNPSVRFTAGTAQEFYKKGGRGEVIAIDRELFSHFAEVRWYAKQFVDAGVKWTTTYDDNDTSHALDFSSFFNKGPVSGQVAYTYNHTTRDPVEAIEQRGRTDTLKLNGKVDLLGRIEVGHNLDVDWYRVEGSRNIINGADHLGHKFTSDAFVSLALTHTPYVSINYHFRNAHWNRKFDRADEVISYLSDEQIHAFGVYAEYHIAHFLEVIASVTRGSDRKRHVDYINWLIGAHIWINDHARVGFEYEYDYGDSGTAGSGNSQIMTTSAEVYF